MALAELIRRIPMVDIAEPRGSLTAVEFESLPFTPRRLFLVSGVPPGTARGGHAHRTAVQLIVCLAGEIEAKLRHGDEEETLILQPGDDALLIPPGVWSSQRYRTSSTMLLVLVSEPYTKASYVT